MTWWMLLLIAPFAFVALVVLAVHLLAAWVERKNGK